MNLPISSRPLEYVSKPSTNVRRGENHQFVLLDQRLGGTRIQPPRGMVLEGGGGRPVPTTAIISGRRNEESVSGGGVTDPPPDPYEGRTPNDVRMFPSVDDHHSNGDRDTRNDNHRLMMSSSSGGSGGAVVSQRIPIIGDMTRSPSELQLDHNEAMAEYREAVMYRRVSSILHGNNSNDSKQHHRNAVSLPTTTHYENDKPAVLLQRREGEEAALAAGGLGVLVYPNGGAPPGQRVMESTTPSLNKAQPRRGMMGRGNNEQTLLQPFLRPVSGGGGGVDDNNTCALFLGRDDNYIMKGDDAAVHGTMNGGGYYYNNSNKSLGNDDHYHYSLQHHISHVTNNNNSSNNSLDMGDGGTYPTPPAGPQWQWQTTHQQHSFANSGSSVPILEPYSNDLTSSDSYEEEGVFELDL